MKPRVITRYRHSICRPDCHLVHPLLCNQRRQSWEEVLQYNLGPLGRINTVMRNTVTCHVSFGFCFISRRQARAGHLRAAHRLCYEAGKTGNATETRAAPARGTCENKQTFAVIHHLADPIVCVCYSSSASTPTPRQDALS